MRTMRRTRNVLLVVCSVTVGLVFAPGPASNAAEPVVTFGPSDAVSIPLLSGTYYVNDKMAGGLPYWWDHTALTAAVQAAPSADAGDVQAIHDAIALWSSVLASRLPEVSLTDISASPDTAKSADIVVHLIPHAGGARFGGNAQCGSQKCMNIIVRTDEPPGAVGRFPDYFDFDPVRVQREALHELGHALGLGHAQPLLTSTDIMGYGWAMPDPDVIPILSDCDLLGIRTAFSWYFDGEAPHASPIRSVTC